MKGAGIPLGTWLPLISCQTIKRPDLVKYVRSTPHGRLMAEIAHAYEVQEYLDVWPGEDDEDPYILLKPFRDRQEVP